MMPTLAKRTPLNTAPGAAGPLAPLPAGNCQYTAAGSNFEQLVSDALGNAGTSADGFDSAFALIEGLLSALDTGSTQIDSAITDFETAADVFMAIDDNLTPALAAAAALYDASESGLFTAFAALQSLGAKPAPVSLPAEPSIASIPAPTGIDVGSAATSASGGGAVGTGGDILAAVLASILASPTTGAGAALAAFGVGAAAGPIGLAIAAGVLLITLLLNFIGGGCGSACIKSAEAEQIYEVAADNLWQVAGKLKMLSYHDYYTLINACLTSGTIHMQQLAQSGDSKANQGLANMTRVIEAELTLGATLPTTAPNKLDLTLTPSVYISPAASGWYATSVAAGNQVTDSLLNAGADGITAALEYLLAQA